MLFRSGAWPVPLPRWHSLPRCRSPQGRSPAYPFFRKEKIQLCVRGRNCDAGRFERTLLRSCFLRRRKYPARRKELFSLRKKRTAGIRLSAWQKAGSLYRLNPTPFPPLKKPFKNYGFQGDLDPRCAASGASRRLEAEPRGLPRPRRSLKEPRSPPARTRRSKGRRHRGFPEPARIEGRLRKGGGGCAP